MYYTSLIYFPLVKLHPILRTPSRLVSSRLHPHLPPYFNLLSLLPTRRSSTFFIPATSLMHFRLNTTTTLISKYSLAFFAIPPLLLLKRCSYLSHFSKLCLIQATGWVITVILSGQFHVSKVRVFLIKIIYNPICVLYYDIIHNLLVFWEYSSNFPSPS